MTKFIALDRQVSSRLHAAANAPEGLKRQLIWAYQLRALFTPRMRHQARYVTDRVSDSLSLPVDASPFFFHISGVDGFCKLGHGELFEFDWVLRPSGDQTGLSFRAVEAVRARSCRGTR